MTLDQMYELAKNGMSPAGIKELQELEKNCTQTEEAAEILPEEEAQPEQQNADDSVPEPSEDIRSLQSEIEKLKADLKAAQEANTSISLQQDEKKNPIEDIVRDFMN